MPVSWLANGLPVVGHQDQQHNLSVDHHDEKLHLAVSVITEERSSGLSGGRRHPRGLFADVCLTHSASTRRSGHAIICWTTRGRGRSALPVSAAAHALDAEGLSPRHVRGGSHGDASS